MVRIGLQPILNVQVVAMCIDLSMMAAKKNRTHAWPGKATIGHRQEGARPPRQQAVAYVCLQRTSGPSFLGLVSTLMVGPWKTDLCGTGLNCAWDSQALSNGQKT